MIQYKTLIGTDSRSWETELSPGFSSFAVYENCVVILAREDGTAVAFHSELLELSNTSYLEVGRLRLFPALPTQYEIPRFPLPEEFKGQIRLQFLIADTSELAEAGFEVESGVILTAHDKELLIVAGVCPFSVTARANFAQIEPFTPEFDIDTDYRIEEHRTISGDR